MTASGSKEWEVEKILNTRQWGHWRVRLDYRDEKAVWVNRVTLQ
jgi:hypothetical protein